jgi:cytochrome c biogenesis protein CcdA
MGEKKVVLILLILSFLAIAAILIFYIVTPNPSHIIGNQLVNNPNGGPEEFPPPSVSPLYAKPVTYLFAAGIVFGYCIFSLGQGIINESFPRSLRALILIISVLLLAMGAYEVFFNFTLWSALIARNPNMDPDTAVNMWPINSIQINLAYATKMSILWTIVAFFSVMTFKNSLESSKKN